MTRARTPLQAAIDRLVRVLVVIAAVVCGVVAVVRLYQGFGWLDAVVSAVTLATAALPEEFPLVFTVFLGVGAFRLARRHALVQRAVSVENIGRVTCICSDKTGTITEGQLTVTELIADPSLSRTDLLRLARLASRPDVGDPLDVAVAAAAHAADVTPDGRVLATFPFTESRKRETAIVSERDGRVLAVTKGAPEVVLALSAMSPADRQTWEARVAALADGGAKVLACAWRSLEAETKDSPTTEPETDYRLAGILAFGDPVREGVVAAVAACRVAGIHTIMVTGDHPRSALAVARTIGLGGDAPVVITGDELEAVALRGDRTLGALDVVARATPAQRLRLVQALQRSGEVVAVTGDGVNDVPALQAADVGIAMGERATQSAREVASIVLLDDNFGTIVRAVGEGRQLFQNLRRSFQYLLMIHAPLVLAAAVIPLAGYPLLFLPAHLVWLELIMHPTALLAFQAPARSERMAPRSAGRDTRMLSPADWVVVTGVGLLLTALVVSAYMRNLGDGGGVEHGRSAALAVLTLASALISGALGRLGTATGVILSAGTIVVSAVLIQARPIGSFLGLQPLDADDWAVAALGALGVAAIPLIAEALRSRGWIRAPGAQPRHDSKAGPP